MLSYYLLCLLPLVYLFRKQILSLFIPSSLPGIPAYPDPSPFLGDIPRVARVMKAAQGFSVFFDQASKDLGPICQIRLSFFRKFVVLADYAEIEMVLSKRTKTFDRSIDTITIFQSILPKAQIGLPTNDMWKHHRRIIGTAMTSKYLSLTTPRANESIQHLVDLWKTKMKKTDLAFPVEHDMEGATMDAICGMAFGHSWNIIHGFTEQVKNKPLTIGSVGEASFEHELPLLSQCTWTIFNTLPTKSSFPKISHFISSLAPSYRRANKIMDDFLEQKLVEARIRAKERGADAAEVADNTLDMMAAREMKAEDWMPNDEMKQEVFQYLLAGTETSGVTLSWFVKYMTNNPQFQHRLRDHVISKLPELQDRQPNFEDLNAINLPYLEAVVHECLRLSRTAGGYTREVMEDCVVLGKVIPKGTVILTTTVTSYEDLSNPISASLAGTTETDTLKIAESLNDLRYEDAVRKVGYWKAGTGLQFDPERWLDADGKFNINAGPSLPFSLGQRGCFGKNLALLELRLFICQLNYHFFFAPVAENQNSSSKFETVATHPVQCFIRPVSWDSPEAQLKA